MVGSARGCMTPHDGGVIASLGSLKTLFQRLWHSPTFTTWGSTGTRFLSLVLVLPLLLRNLVPAEIAVWYLLSTIISLQGLADLGFAPTFTRLIAYGMGGARELGSAPQSSKTGQASEPNW